MGMEPRWEPRSTQPSTYGCAASSLWRNSKSGVFWDPKTKGEVGFSI